MTFRLKVGDTDHLLPENVGQAEHSRDQILDPHKPSYQVHEKLRSTVDITRNY